MGPFQQPLAFQDRKIFAQRGLADFEDRGQFIQMDPPATRDESRDFLLSLCGKNGGRREILVLGHRLVEGKQVQTKEIKWKHIAVNSKVSLLFDIDLIVDYRR